MPTEATPRFALPFLAVSQAQKELIHNESLLLVDAMLHPRVEAVESDPALIVDPQEGQAWIIGASPVGIWADRMGHIAIWTSSGWRYVEPTSPMTVWLASENNVHRFQEGSWSSPPTLPDAASGGTVDSEARAAINQLLAYLRNIGLIAAS